MEKTIREYTKKELLEMENFGADEIFDSLVIVPTNRKHDSGWKCMKFILVRGEDVVGAASGWSDVVHLNGIGGYGKDFDIYKMQRPIGWCIDCLPKSGCLRLFCHRDCSLDGLISPDFCLSDFCVYVEDKK